MTSLWLFLSGVFKWSFQFYDHFANGINWVLFIVATSIFVYWCWELIGPLGNNTDNAYKSPSKQVRPYYDTNIMHKK